MKNEQVDSPKSSRSCAELQEALSDQRLQLFSHPLYQRIPDLASLRIFMESHIFAVWDFMSLVKALQQRLTCASTPWRPVGDRFLRRYINEIVLEEESDEDGEGGFASHFELYLAAMEEAGADTTPAEQLIQSLREGDDWRSALHNCGAPDGAFKFSTKTMTIVAEAELHEVAAAFAVGREGLIPPMFIEILDSLETSTEKCWSKLAFYLKKHIELDQEHHGPMAARLLDLVCGEDEQKWADAERVASETLQARHDLWLSVLTKIESREGAMGGEQVC